MSQRYLYQNFIVSFDLRFFENRAPGVTQLGWVSKGEYLSNGCSKFVQDRCPLLLPNQHCEIGHDSSSDFLKSFF